MCCIGGAGCGDIFEEIVVGGRGAIGAGFVRALQNKHIGAVDSIVTTSRSTCWHEPSTAASRRCHWPTQPSSPCELCLDTYILCSHWDCLTDYLINRKDYKWRLFRCLLGTRGRRNGRSHWGGGCSPRMCIPGEAAEATAATAGEVPALRGRVKTYDGFFEASF